MQDNACVQPLQTSRTGCDLRAFHHALFPWSSLLNLTVLIIYTWTRPCLLRSLLLSTNTLWHEFLHSLIQIMSICPLRQSWGILSNKSHLYSWKEYLLPAALNPRVRPHFSKATTLITLGAGRWWKHWPWSSLLGPPDLHSITGSARLPGF